MVLKPATIRKRVVFPHPEGPRRVKNSPFLMSNDSSGITFVSPYFFITSWKDMVTLIVTT
ncbi:hypothetical protein D3C79_1050880 [compost metagenome]